MANPIAFAHLYTFNGVRYPRTIIVVWLFACARVCDTTLLIELRAKRRQPNALSSLWSRPYYYFSLTWMFSNSFPFSDFMRTFHMFSVSFVGNSNRSSKVKAHKIAAADASQSKSLKNEACTVYVVCAYVYHFIASITHGKRTPLN